MKFKKIVAAICVMTISVSSFGIGYAENMAAPYDNSADTIKVKPADKMVLNATKAAKYALEHSIIPGFLSSLLMRAFS